MGEESHGFAACVPCDGGGTAMTATIMPPELVAKWKQEYVVPCVAYLASEEVEASGDALVALPRHVEVDHVAALRSHHIGAAELFAAPLEHHILVLLVERLRGLAELVGRRM